MTAAALAREFAQLRTLQRLLRLYEVTHGPVCGITQLRQHVIMEMRRVAKLMRYGLPAILVLLLVTTAHAQEHHHPAETITGATALFYETWRRPDLPTHSCCDKKDCYATPSRRSAGRLQALHRETGRWLDIPPEKVELNRDSPDGQSHLCASPQMLIFCFKEGFGT